MRKSVHCTWYPFRCFPGKWAVHIENLCALLPFHLWLCSVPKRISACRYSSFWSRSTWETQLRVRQRKGFTCFSFSFRGCRSGCRRRSWGWGHSCWFRQSRGRRVGRSRWTFWGWRWGIWVGGRWRDIPGWGRQTVVRCAFRPGRWCRFFFIYRTRCIGFLK